MRYTLIFAAMISGTMASAHPGHLIDVAGHDHWLAAGALAAAAAIALAALIGKARDKDREAQDEDAEPDENASQEA
ncbi:MAG: DUF6732 family protein [Pseudomonadota bacterium]